MDSYVYQSIALYLLNHHEQLYNYSNNNITHNVTVCMLTGAISQINWRVSVCMRVCPKIALGYSCAPDVRILGEGGRGDVSLPLHSNKLSSRRNIWGLTRDWAVGVDICCTQIIVYYGTYVYTVQLEWADISTVQL